MSHQTKEKSQVIEIRPTPMAAGIAQSLGGKQPEPIVAGIRHNKKDNWAIVDEIAQATGDLIAVSVNGINETVEAVKTFGCVHVNEFNATVNKTNEDLQRFADDYVKIRQKHEGRKGAITSMEDRALSVTVVEEYRNFQAMFNGVMGHTVIAFTEFALEAKDRQKAMAAASTPSEETPQ